MKLRERVIVLGAGVIGLTTALRLLERGFRVDVVADRRHPATTSDLAAGLWYPYKVGGARVAGWALATLSAYRQLARISSTGVNLVPCASLVPPGEPSPYWSDADVDFEGPGPSKFGENGEAVAFRATLPVAQPAIFLPWLESNIVARGGSIRILDRPLGHISALPGTLIVNCTGLGARNVCRDSSVAPIRGAVLHVAGTGIEESMTDERDSDQPTYIIPSRDFCVLGGSAQSGRWDTSVSADEASDILNRCSRLDRRVLQGTVLGAYAGLRPGRPEVRLEAEVDDAGRTIVHNYGHGGSGFTLAWGCAEEVVDIVSTESERMMTQ